MSPESFSSGLNAVEVPALETDDAESFVVVLLFRVTGLPSRGRYHFNNGNLEWTAIGIFLVLNYDISTLHVPHIVQPQRQIRRIGEHRLDRVDSCVKIMFFIIVFTYIFTSPGVE